MISLYPFYKKQVLPFSGGVLEQPANYLAAMELLEYHLETREAKK
ncbi:hypothetical protein ACFOE0_00300 [Shewanella submarina]|uniref:Uncharacterized protein n=1 Tax=Shewanella submarina TaxID=2016376 RepID=A0ABV7GB31_9GAMM|nr:hypothetical protein [Shewanella submarina]